MTIAEIACDSDSFTTLCAALRATGLYEVLNVADGVEYTVFAPTDDAIAELGQPAITALLADLDTLSYILLYHVVPDAAIASDNLPPSSTLITMANGKDTRLIINGDGVFIKVRF